jgi:hypothetical protein
MSFDAGNVSVGMCVTLFEKVCRVHVRKNCHNVSKAQKNSSSEINVNLKQKCYAISTRFGVIACITFDRLPNAA